MDQNKIKEYAEKKFKINIFNYSITSILLVGFYVILFLSIMNDGIFSYKAGIYINVLIYVLFALSLNVTAGIMGELNLGHAGFISIGAYSASVLSKFLYQNYNFDGTLLLIIASLFGALMAALFGIIVGIFTFRLRGDYLAIITLAFGEIIKYVIQNINFLGGAAGLNGIPGIVTFTNVYVIVILSAIALVMILVSKKGRELLSIREDEIAAENMGVNLNKAKVYGFMLSAFFAGIGGSLFAHSLGTLTPDKFNFIFSIEILVMVVLGGLGSLTGAVVSATFLTIFNEFLRSASEYRGLIYAIILILIMLFRREGLLGINEFTIGGFVRYLKKIKQKVIK